MLKKIVISLFLLFITQVLYAKNKLVVLNFASNTVDKTIVKDIQNSIEKYFVDLKSYNVINRKMIDVLLKVYEQKDSCKDTVCAVKFGKLFRSNLIVIGEVEKTKNYIITIKLINIAGTILYIYKREYETTESILKNSRTIVKGAHSYLIDNTNMLSDKKTDGNITLVKKDKIPNQSTTYLLKFQPGYLIPLVKFDEMFNAGIGGNLILKLPVKLYMNSYLDVFSGFWYFPGDETKYIHTLLVPLLVGISKPIFINQFNIDLHLRVGATFNQLRYDQDYNEQTSSAVNSKAYLQIVPHAQAGIDFSYLFANSFALSIGCNINAIIEKTMFYFLDTHLGAIFYF